MNTLYLFFVFSLLCLLSLFLCFLLRDEVGGRWKNKVRPNEVFVVGPLTAVLGEANYVRTTGDNDRKISTEVGSCLRGKTKFNESPEGAIAN